VGTVHRCAHRGALVFLTEYRAARARAPLNCWSDLVRMAVSQQSIGIRALHRRVGPVRDVLPRHCHQLVADDRAYARAGCRVGKHRPFL
jgi:hypothetical protein